MAPVAVQEDGEEGRGEPDDELDDMGVPRGWRECPPMGRPIERFLPMKVPLGAHFDRVIAPEHRFHIDAALEAAHAALAGLTYPLPQLDEAGRPVRTRACAAAPAPCSRLPVLVPGLLLLLRRAPACARPHRSHRLLQ